MCNLVDVSGNAIPARPILTDDIKRNGVMAAIESKNLTRVIKEDAEAFIKDIVKHYSNGIDAYELAKDMEDECWNVDAQFVDDMEQVDGYIQEALRKAEADWGAAYHPVPPFKSGTKLSVCSFGHIEFGVIDGLCQSTPAAFLVKMEGTPDGCSTRRIIRFEEAAEAK